MDAPRAPVRQVKTFIFLDSEDMILNKSEQIYGLRTYNTYQTYIQGETSLTNLVALPATLGENLDRVPEQCKVSSWRNDQKSPDTRRLLHSVHMIKFS